jgi:DNA topoisomerase IB
LARELRRVRWCDPGITRRRAGKGWVYLDPKGRQVTDPETLARIKSLVIPPAWTDVWICPYPNGHIQAVGLDARGRRQYIYHPRWRVRRDHAKFDRMVSFARALPDLRCAVDELLACGEDLSRDRVLACAVRLLDEGFFRVGGERYAKENAHFGLATVLKSHVVLQKPSTLVFDYPAKSGQRRIQSVVDPDAFGIVSRLKARRGGGPELLAFREGRAWVDVRSSDINHFIRKHAPGECSAKDFRTWGATVLAAMALSVSTEVRSERERTRAISRAVQEVAHYLGNTPAVARRSYIDPRVIDFYEQGATIDPAIVLERQGDGAGIRDALEAAVVDLLEGAHRVTRRHTARAS